MNIHDKHPTTATPSVNVEQIINHKFPSFTEKPSPLKRSTLFFLKKLIHENEINSFLAANEDAQGFEFIDRVLEHFKFSYNTSSRDRANIPSSGRVIIIANHPLGALDGLAMLKMVGEVRRDVKIIANDLLMNVEQLSDLILPVDNLGKNSRKRDIHRITSALQDEQAIVIFPAGEVSRIGMTGIKDKRWNSGFLRFAKKTNTPILPVYIGGKNSSLFYSASFINRSLSSLLLAREMFNKHSVSLPMRVGEPIPFSHIDSIPLSTQEKAKLLKKHLYRIGKNKSPLFRTVHTIAHPQDRQRLRKELKQAILLGETSDSKKIYLVDYQPDSDILKEIGRLREEAFRHVGEGTGNKQDLDHFDKHYRHLVLWDEEELEIAGAYRLAEVFKMKSTTAETLYSSTLFNYSPEMRPFFEQGIELGRSFVQPKYWGKRSLDYLWYGIGAYLRTHPEVRYMFGPVSLSNNYPQSAKDMLVWFYRHYFSDTDHLAHSFAPYTLDSETKQLMHRLFCGNDYTADFRIMKEQLAFMGLSIPTLFKQYSELCEEGGVRFLDFGVDADFNFCVDGLVLVDIEKVKTKKRLRYIGV